MPVFSGAISTELPPAQPRIKAQLQAAECQPCNVQQEQANQVSLNFLSEQRSFCFHLLLEMLWQYHVFFLKRGTSCFPGYGLEKKNQQSFQILCSQGYSKEFLCPPYSCTKRSLFSVVNFRKSLRFPASVSKTQK